MKWAKTTKYQATLSVDGIIHNVVLEYDDSYALFVNRQYIMDLEYMPEYDELVSIIEEQVSIDYAASQAMAIQSKNIRYNGF